MMTTAYQTNFWRCNQTKEIRVGTFDESGVFHAVATVSVEGDEYSDAEARKAERICRSLNRVAA